MKKLILLSVLAIVVASCGYEIRKKPEPPKPKLTKEQIRKQEYEQRLEDYNVVFLFECNGVKVYRFRDGWDGRVHLFHQCKWKNLLQVYEKNKYAQP